MEKTAYLKKMRQQRINALKGKCIIICDSPKNDGTILYMQDPALSTKGHWTAYMANAKSFPNEYAANAVCQKLKYNNPRVARVAEK